MKTWQSLLYLTNIDTAKLHQYYYKVWNFNDIFEKTLPPDDLFSFESLKLLWNNCFFQKITSYNEKRQGNLEQWKQYWYIKL